MYFEFREPLDRVELNELFELRHRAYRVSELRGFVVDEKHRRQFGIHDKLSRHFGLFRSEHNARKPVGYLRVVELFDDRDHHGRRQKLPFEDDFITKTPHVQSMVDGLLKKHGMVIEPSRFCLDPTSRSHGLARFMAKCVAAVYGVGIEAPVLITCHRAHQSFYETLGFRRVFRNARLLIAGVSGRIAMYGHHRCLAEPTRHKLRELLEAYRNHGAIAYDTEAPMNPVPREQQVTPSVFQLALRAA